jgi:hypothetical protein
LVVPSRERPAENPAVGISSLTFLRDPATVTYNVCYRLFLKFGPDRCVHF